jgi:HPt (histidine-containing phosphotransfer) domain-containing protein
MESLTRNPMPPLDDPSFDAEAVLIHVDNDRDLLRELAELLCEDAPNTMDRIREAAENEDAEALWQAAHALKGAVANFAALGARDLAQTLERKGREGDLDGAPGLVQRLEVELERLFQDLRSFVDPAND